MGWKSAGYKKLDYCERCVKEFPSFILQVDHIDGDRYNDALYNFQTLCANCHVAKTIACKDYLPKYKIKEREAPTMWKLMFPEKYT